MSKCLSVIPIALVMISATVFPKNAHHFGQFGHIAEMDRPCAPAVVFEV